jgi:hypothetical protein
MELKTMPLKREAKNKISFITKLFCISLAVEPLMFFVLSDPHQSGLAFTLSRLFQIFVGIYFVIYVIKKRLILPNLSYKYYNFYFKYLITGLFSMALGFFFYDSYILVNAETATEISSAMVSIIRGPYSRPFFEIFVAVYYFFYFVVAPKYVLKNEYELKYLLDLLIFLFKFGLIIGMFDIVQYLVSGVNFIPRHLIDSEFVQLGTRYHGFAGEPRDAFPYLVFGLAIYYLRSALFKIKQPSKLIVVMAVCAILLTQSTSGLVGVIFAIFIYLFMEIRINLASMPKLALQLVFFSILILIISINTERIMDYVTATEGLYNTLKEGDALHPYMAAQAGNIYPLWQILRSVVDLNLLPVFFGFGFGSVSFVNNNVGGMVGLVNPQSNAVRLFYEVGLLGALFYVASQILLIRDASKNFLNSNGRIFYLLAILLAGLCLGHRSTTIFILCGIALAVISNKRTISKLSL